MATGSKRSWAALLALFIGMSACNAILGIGAPNAGAGGASGTGASGPGSGGGDMMTQVGDGCAHDGDCVTGHCVDSVCCDGPCDGACVACNVAGSLGSCLPVAMGGPSPGGHPACEGQAPSTCGEDGSCDGTGHCALQPAGTICGASKCDKSSQKFTPAPTCNGHGTCVPPAAIDCAPYVCENETQCWASCTGNMDCESPHTCSGGSCGAKPQGSSCGSDSECGTGHCADGVCCNGSCTEVCESCNQPQNLGTCLPITGKPVGKRANCPGYGTPCGSSCDGTDTKSCTYPGTSTTCNDGHACTSSDHCDGMGHCTGTTVTCPADPICKHYACNGTTCVLTNLPNGTSCGECTCGDMECNGSGVCKSIACHSLPCP